MMGNGFHSILVGVDESANAQKAFQYAVKKAAHENIELVIASILESDEINVYQALDDDYLRLARKKTEENLRSISNMLMTKVYKPLNFLAMKVPLLNELFIISCHKPNVTYSLLDHTLSMG